MTQWILPFDFHVTHSLIALHDPVQIATGIEISERFARKIILQKALVLELNKHHLP